MSIGDILEIALFGILAVSILLVVLAVLKNLPGGKKGTKFRTSKKGG